MRKPYVVGIAGGSASGKSTFSDALVEMLRDCKVLCLHMDEYFRSEQARPQSKAPVSGKVYMDDNHPTTMDLARLREDLDAAISTGGYDAIIVEGLLTLYDDALIEQLDLKLFVDAKADERIVRRLRRNMQWGLSFDEVSNVYLDLVRYRHDEYVEPSKWRADLILNGSSPSEVALKMVAAQITLAVREGSIS